MLPARPRGIRAIAWFDQPTLVVLPQVEYGWVSGAMVAQEGAPG